MKLRPILLVLALALHAPLAAAQSTSPAIPGGSLATPVTPTNGGSGVANTGNWAWNAAQTFSVTSGQTMTLPAASTTLAGLGTVQTFTAAQTNSTASAASTPAQIYTGVIFTGGSGTTTFPHVLVQPSTATASSTWSTTGTALGVNAHTGIGNLIDLQLDGSSKFSVNNSGSTNVANGLTVGGSIQSGAAFAIQWATRGILTSSAAGNVQLGTADAAAPVAQTLSAQSVVAGTSNVAGANTTIQGSASTGSGTGGSITFKTSLATAAATTVNTQTTAEVIDGVQHVTLGGGTPTCGTGCSSIAANATDQRMTITTGTAVSAVTVNFAKTWVNVPVCVATDNSTVALTSISAISVTAVTITTAAALTTAPIYLICL